MKPNNLLLYSVLFFVTAIHTNAQNWNLVWADEFETDGSIDDERWFQQSQLPNGYSWYNNELQHYTDEIENSYVSNGTLKIVAKKENYTDQGHTKQYTSARLNSKFSFTYGKVEVRAKLPFGQGTWPAIWTLGKNVIEPGGYWTNQGYGTTSWPNCGEIDIMEHWGINQNYIQSATHTPSSFGGTINHGGQNISTASSEFHTYGLIWTEDQLIFSVDDQVHFTYNPPLKDSETWPFDAEQYLLMNIAIDQNITSDFQQSTLEVDYVRVYQSINSDLSFVNFTVDMNGVDQPSADYDNVVVNGSWNGWNGWGVTLSDDNQDGLWTGSLELAPGTSFEYVVAVTGPADAYSGWGLQWGDGCQGSNVSVTVGSSGSVTETSLLAGCSDISGCMDLNASNYDMDATEQQLDQYGNINCLYTSCNEIPEPGCIYTDGFGPFNAEFTSSDCITYGGTPCEGITSELNGCMDENATNYNINATIDNGTCEYDVISDLSFVNFTVDMNGVDQPSADYDNVVVNGSWNGWNGWGVTLSDDNQDGLWTGSLELAPGTSFEYVVAVTGPADAYSGWGLQWGDGCQGSNVSVTVGSSGSVTETSLLAGCSDISGCMDLNASNYDMDATEQQLDQYGNINCLYTSCNEIPEPGCIYTDGFGPFNAEFTSSDCITYGGTPCEGITSELNGCMDENATNYNINATIDNGTCEYACLPSWQVTVTDQNHSIFISGVSYDLDGNILSDGSLIGVFYYSNEMYLCAGYTQVQDGIMQISVMGDDVATDEMDGLVNGSPLLFMVWDINLCEMYPANVLFSNGPEIYISNGITFITDIIMQPNGPTSQEINCLSGWTIFSTYMKTLDMQMTSILSSIENDVIIAKDYLGAAFLPEFSFNGIGELTVGWGYQLKMENERSLIIDGDYAFPENNIIELSAGWNLIGYLRTMSAPTDSVFSDLVDEGNLIIIKDYLGAAFLPEYDFNGIGNMQPGQGYQIKLVDSGILQYLANDLEY